MTAAVNSPSNAHTYTPALITLHWLTVLVIAAVFTAIELKGYFPKGSPERPLTLDPV